MKLVETKCPSCGAQINVDADNKQTTCEFCGANVLLDDEAQHITYDNAESAGYQFEKGRIKAQKEHQGQQAAPAATTTPASTVVVVQEKPKRRTWLWVLGWICIFPVPLTILLMRNKSLNKNVRIGIIVAAWLLYCIIGLCGIAAGGTSSKHSTATTTTEVTQTQTAEKESAEKPSETTDTDSDDTDKKEETVTAQEETPVVKEEAPAVKEETPKWKIKSSLDFPAEITASTEDSVTVKFTGNSADSLDQFLSDTMTVDGTTYKISDGQNGFEGFPLTITSGGEEKIPAYLASIALDGGTSIEYTITGQFTELILHGDEQTWTKANQRFDFEDESVTITKE